MQGLGSILCLGFLQTACQHPSEKPILTLPLSELDTTEVLIKYKGKPFTGIFRDSSSWDGDTAIFSCFREGYVIEGERKYILDKIILDDKKGGVIEDFVLMKDLEDYKTRRLYDFDDGYAVCDFQGIDIQDGNCFVFKKDSSNRNRLREIGYYKGNLQDSLWFTYYNNSKQVDYYMRGCSLFSCDLDSIKEPQYIKHHQNVNLDGQDYQIIFDFYLTPDTVILEKMKWNILIFMEWPPRKEQ